MLSGKFPRGLKEIEDSLKKWLSSRGPNFILEFSDQKSVFTNGQIAICGESANHRRLYG